MEQWPQSQGLGWRGDDCKLVGTRAAGDGVRDEVTVGASWQGRPSSWALCQEGRREVCSPHRAGRPCCPGQSLQAGAGGAARARPARQGRGEGRGPLTSRLGGGWTPIPSPLEGLSHGGRGSHPLIGAGVWRGCRGREIALEQSCPHWPALPPSFAPPRRPLRPCIPAASRLPPPASPQAPLQAAFEKQSPALDTQNTGRRATLEGFWPSLHLGDQADLTHLKSYCKQAKEQS